MYDNKVMRKRKNILTGLLLCLVLTGCTFDSEAAVTPTPSERPAQTQETITETAAPEPTETPVIQTAVPEITSSGFSLDQVPAYSGSPYVTVNNNHPFFDESTLKAESYEAYSILDSLGRCGIAEACLGQDLMPTEERGSIGMIQPTGWHTIRYDDLIADKYLYNRCHLIAYELAGENANELNLITGTRYMNVEGMLPFENETADFIQNTGRHVQYRVTPVFEGNNLLASGVLMEAESVEDLGQGLMFCVYCYNVQPGITISYADGSSERAVQSAPTPAQTQQAQVQQPAETHTYIVNINTGRFHYPECSSVKQMKDKNKMEFTGDRQELISQGYQPCQNCNP